MDDKSKSEKAVPRQRVEKKALGSEYFSTLTSQDGQGNSQQGNQGSGATDNTGSSNQGKDGKK
jgi:hypothetical protein